MHWLPSPIDTVSESIDPHGEVALERFGGDLGRLHGPESRDDRLMQSTPSAPASPSARNRSSNAPGAGAAVSGSTGEVATLRQNSAFDSSTRSTNSSSPKRIVRGTISMPSASARAWGRSQELSVTIRTATEPPRVGDAGWRRS